MDQEEIKILKRKRATIKSKLTLFKKYVDLVEEQTKDNERLNEVEITSLQIKCNNCEPLLDEFDQIQGEIECLLELNEIENELPEREEFQGGYYHALATGKTILEAHAPKTLDDAASSVSSNKTNADAGSVANSGCVSGNVKLPTITLPKFSGEYDTWLEFRDTFKSLVHDKPDISNIHKFHYLKASLENSAAKLLHAYELSSDNYEIIWDTLNERYNNKNLLVQNHIKALFNLEPMQRASSAKIRNLIDTVGKHLRSLKSLNEPVDFWDTLVIFMITGKLDSYSGQEWEKYKADKGTLTLTDLNAFLKSRADVLETIELNQGEKATNKSKFYFKDKPSQSKSLLAVNTSCVICKGNNHQIYTCGEFQKLNHDQRIERSNQLKLCFNCLKHGHTAQICKFGHCRKCSVKHNTLLHVETQQANDTNTNTTQQQIQEPPVSLAVYNEFNQQVLLATVCVLIYDDKNNEHTIRAVLDCGSQTNIISQSCFKKLNLTYTQTNLSVIGIHGTATRTSKQCQVKIKAMHSPFELTLNCAILPEIPGRYPSLNITNLRIPANLPLADRSFGKPNKVEMLIGSEDFWELISTEQIKLGKGQPTLQNTKLGWVVAGTAEGFSKQIFCNLSTCQITPSNLDNNLQSQLTKFWELEEVSIKPTFSKEEQICESHFQTNTTRCEDGRFMVSIPTSDTPDKLGDSKANALKRFYSLERKLSKNPVMYEKYKEFMSEYETLGHMTKITDRIPNNDSCYYLPHHGVLREERETTKLRVVFDGSAATDNGLSFNNIHMVGPVIQDDLFAILIRFRKHMYVIAADIQKMYRQVLIRPDERKMQRILWRSDVACPIDTYELNTITYGLASSSFLAIRCLQQLANECQNELPLISNIITNDFYVDDIITGSETIENARYICQGVSRVLKRGCFDLKKWVSNDIRCLTDIPQNDWSQHALEFGVDSKAKTLGLAWSCKTDTLKYYINFVESNEPITKRVILSTIAQIFDPLGLLSPCIIIAKMIIQKLWLENLSWDEVASTHVTSSWNKLYNELPSLNALNIQRQVICKNSSKIELHGFSDACEGAFGGCIYVRSTDQIGEVHTHLLCAKSKVAPLKVLTIPRLELNGALILARLFDKVVKSLKIEFDSCTFWSDSTIVLGWLRTAPNLLQTFVGNRVSEIIELTKSGEWRHVPTSYNPADLLSRGVSPTKLAHSALWWNGPNWLAGDCSSWPDKKNPEIPKLPELRDKRTCLAISCQPKALITIENYSNLNRLERTVAYVLRFVSNCKLKSHEAQSRLYGPLTAAELQTALHYLVKSVQSQSYGHDLSKIQKQFPKLFPFKDEGGMIRIAGRLKNANIPHDKKHPPILPANHHLTKLIFLREHLRLLHAGPQMLLASLRDKFWPISGRNLARKTVHSCVTCFRANPKTVSPPMGNLPKHRVQPAAPFHVTGVDYMGPFMLKDKRGRGGKLSKCYVSLFICFATKAIHLELVTGLTTNLFIMALRRFVSRRGLPLHIYSDNGTNFVGAKSELSELRKFLIKNENVISDSLTSHGINWHFIPPRTPHFGGLWEAGVRSVKFHFKRIAGNSHLTFEEMYTLLTQIEAILNSRPTFPLSTDIDDLNPITPAHFLVGRSLVSVPDEDLLELPINRMTIYQRIQQLQQHFWRVWHKGYLSELQLRTKPSKENPSIKIGDLVVIKEDNLPPMKWCLGRVVEVFPGSDNIIRVVSLKTKSGVIKRGVKRLCRLPIDELK